VESDAVAEEIVQGAFLRAVERASDLESDESAVAWFYRMLRNAIVDHYRRRETAGRVMAELANEPTDAAPEIPPDDKAHTCACVSAIARTLKPQYAEIVEQVDIEERPLADVAARAGISISNATVRLHRARKALRKQVALTCRTCAEHGCIDCTCKSD
jgi:RNA polymerase sigma-70 factor (ECF subfamily)